MEYCLLDLADVNPESIISQVIIDKDENNIKKIITTYLREDNKKVKRTSFIKVKERKISKAIYDRINMTKFGAALNKEAKIGAALNKEDNAAITTIGKEVFIESPNLHNNIKIKPKKKKENQKLFKDRKRFTSNTIKNKNFSSNIIKKEKYVPLSKRENNQEYSICITNIPDYFTDRDFLNLGREYGRITNSKLLKSYDDPRLNRGIGFLHYTNQEDMDFAIYKIKGLTIDHLILNAEKTRSKTKSKVI
jgi:hypothetical protein